MKVCNLANSLSDVVADCGAKDLIIWSTLTSPGGFHLGEFEGAPRLPPEVVRHTPYAHCLQESMGPNRDLH